MKIISALLALFALDLLAAERVSIWTGADLKSSSGHLASEAESKGIAGNTLGAWGSHSASLWRRDKSGEAELHKTKIDLIVIEEGSATLITGGTIPGAHSTTANEVRGSSIMGGESKKIGPGDIIRIPANTPHQFVLEKGQSISYFALKLAAK